MVSPVHHTQKKNRGPSTTNVVAPEQKKKKSYNETSDTTIIRGRPDPSGKVQPKVPRAPDGPPSTPPSSLDQQPNNRGEEDPAPTVMTEQERELYKAQRKAAKKERRKKEREAKETAEAAEAANETLPESTPPPPQDPRHLDTKAKDTAIPDHDDNENGNEQGTDSRRSTHVSRKELKRARYQKFVQEQERLQGERAKLWETVIAQQEQTVPLVVEFCVAEFVRVHH